MIRSEGQSELALALLQAKHPDNPDAPFPMVRAGAAMALAAALWDMGWRRSASPAKAEPCPTCTWPSRETTGLVCQTCGWDYAKGEKP